ncbi:hypothetical protein PhCBS80983_g03532 [Powellomyces hirtus]|uniref:Uncharacterized protein n=1 Tax=Powellomyces hirtus TaxID=109895 RepID=A0A507E404_9FUNG|nr:hypothetical protein PhCBS80983_g03532 [Powellomyces hirtus]
MANARPPPMAKQQPQRQQSQQQRRPKFEFNPNDDDKTLREKGRRPVLKNVFESSLTFQWPVLSPVDNDIILELLCALLAPIGEHRRSALKQRSETTYAKVQSRKKAKAVAAQQKLAVETEKMEMVDTTKPQTLAEIEAAQKNKKKKKRKLADVAVDTIFNAAAAPGSAQVAPTTTTTLPPTPPPDIIQSITLGLNKVASELTRQQRHTSLLDTPFKPLRMVFLCSGDITSANLYAHIPTLTYLAGEAILLCPFAKGAQPKLALALGMKSCAALAVKTDAPLFDELHALVASKVPPPSIPWIPRPQPNATTTATTSIASVAQSLLLYQPTKIMTYKTTAPLGSTRRNDQKGKFGNASKKARKDDVKKQSDDTRPS